MFELSTLALMTHLIGIVIYLGLILASYISIEYLIKHQKYSLSDLKFLGNLGKFIPLGVGIILVGGILLLMADYQENHIYADRDLLIYDPRIWAKITWFVIHGVLANVIISKVKKHLAAGIDRDLSDPALHDHVSTLYKLYIPFAISAFIPFFLGAWHGLSHRASYIAIIGGTIIVVILSVILGHIRASLAVKSLRQNNQG